MSSRPSLLAPAVIAMTATLLLAAAPAEAQTVADLASAGALGARLDAPSRLAVGPLGELYAVETRTGVVRPLTPRGDPKRPLALPEPASAVELGAGLLFVGTRGGRLLEVDPADGRVLRTIDLGVSVGPSGLAWDPGQGVLWMTFRDSNCVKGIRADGTPAYEILSAGASPLIGPVDVAVDPVNGLLWVALSTSESGKALHAFLLDGSYLRSALTFGADVGKVTRTGGIAVDGAGRVYVTDLFQDVVQVVSAAGLPLGRFGELDAPTGGLRQPADVAILKTGEPAVANLDAGQLVRFSAGGPLPSCASDRDCDGLPDAWEVATGLDPDSGLDLLLDTDRDGIPNDEEFALGTDPRSADSDGDGFADAVEIATGFDPRNPFDHDTRPVLAASSARESDPGLVRLSATVSRTGCSVQWSQVAGPAVGLRGDRTLSPSFVARAATTYRFRGVAECGGLESEPALVEARIRNVPPRPDPGRTMVVGLGADILLDGSGSSDANGDLLRLVWDQTLGPAAIASTEAPELAFQTFTPALLGFALTATDPLGASATAEVPVLVVDGSGAPTPATSEVVVATEGETVTLGADALASPEAPVTYQWSVVDGPAPVVLANAGTPGPSFVPPRPGLYTLELRVIQRERTSPPARVAVHVAAAGSALPSAEATAPARVVPGQPVELQGSSGSPGASYRWKQIAGPAAGLTDGDRQTATAVPFVAGRYAFELTVEEGGATSLPAVVSFVADANEAALPVAAAVASPVAGVRQVIVLDGTPSSGAGALRYRWTQVDGPWVPLDALGPTAIFRPILPGLYAFELEVADAVGWSAPARVSTLVLGGSSGGTP